MAKRYAESAFRDARRTIGGATWGVPRLVGVATGGVSRQGGGVFLVKGEGCSSPKGGRDPSHYLVPRVGGYAECSQQLLSMFDGYAILHVEHSLFPVSIPCLWSWRGREEVGDSENINIGHPPQLFVVAIATKLQINFNDAPGKFL